MAVLENIWKWYSNYKLQSLQALPRWRLVKIIHTHVTWNWENMAVWEFIYWPNSFVLFVSQFTSFVFMLFISGVSVCSSCRLAPVFIQSASWLSQTLVITIMTIKAQGTIPQTKWKPSGCFTTTRWSRFFVDWHSVLMASCWLSPQAAWKHQRKLLTRHMFSLRQALASKYL